MTTLRELNQRGHAPWLHYLRRSFIESGELSGMIDEGIKGVTVDLSVIGQVIACSSDYDHILSHLQAEGVLLDDLPRALLVDDVQRAATILNPIYESSDRLDGYVSLPIDPALAQETTETVAAVRHLLADINAPNVMVEIPATEAGIVAIEALTHDGVCVNATHIFSLATYERVAQAYLAGLSAYMRTHSIWRRWPTSVATLAISSLDSVYDELLAPLDRLDLQGETGIALAQQVYGRYKAVFSGPVWEKMAAKGAHPQRPLWADLRPRDFRFKETHYTDALLAPHCVSSLSPGVLNAVRGEGIHSITLLLQGKWAQEHLAELSALGLDEAAEKRLAADSVAHLTHDFKLLRDSVRGKREQLEDNWQRLESELGRHGTAVNQALSQMCDDRVMCRIWQHDHTVWQPEGMEIRDRLGWMHLVPVMREQVGRLQQLTESLLADGFTQAVLLGMGGSGLAPQLFADTFNQAALPPRPGLPARPHLQLDVLTNTDPGTILALAERIDPARTIFIVASKSGRTVETMAAFNYFYNRVIAAVGEEQAGGHFLAITDAGSPLAEIAASHQFRHCFINAANLTGRFGSLSFIGLVPAVLAGVNMELIFDRAQGMACNAHGCNCPLEGDNYAAQLGTMLGVLAQAGLDKLTIINSPALEGFADWVEQLVAESTGKDGVGIVPVVGEPVGKPGVYGPDRLFVYLRLEGDDSQDTAVSELKAASFPVITIHWRDLADLGGQFILWQMATAVAAHHLGVNPFSQPQTAAVKADSLALAERVKAEGELAMPDDELNLAESAALHKFLERARAGDYIALQAFTPRTKAIDVALKTLRVGLRDRYQLATLVGYGPRCLHTTGQLLKGGRRNGLIVQLIGNVVLDVLIPDIAGKPDASLTFGMLKELQAEAEAQVLRRGRRRLARFHLGADALTGLQRLSAVEESLKQAA